MVRRRTSARKKRSTAYTGMRTANAVSGPARKNGRWVLLVLGVLVVINLYVFVWDKKTSVRAIAQQAHNAQPALAVPSAPLVAPAPAAVPAAQADEVIRSLSGVLDFRTLKTGEPFRIERGKDGRVHHFELALAKGRKVHSDRQPTGELAARAE